MYRNSYKEIRSIDFNSLEAVDEFVSTFTEFGTLILCQYGAMGDLGSEAIYALKHYESEIFCKRYNYTLFGHKGSSFKLTVYETYLNPMVSAAEIGDLDAFIEMFELRENVIALSLSYSVQNGHMKIIKYLIDNHSDVISQLKLSLTLLAIRKDKPDILDFLLKNKQSLPKDYFAQAVHNNAINVVNYFIYEFNIFKNKNIVEPPNSSWYYRLLKKKNDAVEFLILNGIDEEIEKQFS